MFLASIELRGFGVHDHTKLALSPSGVFIFEGDNGAGKSLIAEAIFWCLYGRTVRTTRGWSPADVDKGTEVTLKFVQSNKMMTVSRRARGRGTRLSITGLDGARNSEGRKHIVKVFGPRKQVMATRIFHRSTMARFSVSTDAERKVLMENLIGIEDFDQWLADVKVERSDILFAQNLSTNSYRKAKERLARIDGAIGELENVSSVDMKSVKANKKRIKAKLARLVVPEPVNTRDVEDRLEVATRRTERCRAAVKAIRRHIDSTKRSLKDDTCPECGQKLVVNKIAIRRKLAEKEEKMLKLVSILAETSETVGDLKKERGTIQAFGKDYYEAENTRRQLVYDLSAVETLLRDELNRIRQHNKRMATLVASKGEAESLVDKAKFEHAILNSRLERLEQLAAVYGPRGARILMLLRAFKYLSKTATDIVVDTYPQIEKVQVKVSSDSSKVTLMVAVRDGEFMSYRGLSEGERSVVDFAVLKALSSIDSTLGQGIPLIYDDVMDALDEKVRPKVADYIANEGKTKQVFVFTHDRSASELFANAEVYNVQEGKVTHGRLS